MSRSSSAVETDPPNGFGEALAASGIPVIVIGASILHLLVQIFCRTASANLSRRIMNKLCWCRCRACFGRKDPVFTAYGVLLPCGRQIRSDICLLPNVHVVIDRPPDSVGPDGATPGTGRPGVMRALPNSRVVAM
jgi:hypothetical protein